MCSWSCPTKNFSKKQYTSGYAAFQSLVKHYHAHGNPQEHANTCLEKLLNLTLNSSTRGGMEMYLSKFEELYLEIQDEDPLY